MAGSSVAGRRSRAATLGLACVLVLVSGCKAKSGSEACGGAACAGAGVGGLPATQLPSSPADAGRDAAQPSADASATPAPLRPRGAAPSAKACVPKGPVPSALGSARTVLFSGARRLGAVAATSSALFVLDRDAGIFRLNSSGVLERVVAAAGVTAFLAADLHLYWFQTDAVFRVSSSDLDATPDRVGGGLSHPARFLSYDTTNLYFADVESRTIARLTLSGEMLSTLVTGVAAADLELRSGMLYYTDTSSGLVYRLSTKAGSAPEALTSGKSSALSAVDSDGTTVYYADGGEIDATPLGKPQAHEALGRGGPGPSGTAFGLIDRLVLAGKRLYFTDDGGNVGFSSVDGSECALLVQGGGELLGFDLGADAAYVVVSSGAGSEVWKLALP